MVEKWEGGTGDWREGGMRRSWWREKRRGRRIGVKKYERKKKGGGEGRVTA